MSSNSSETEILIDSFHKSDMKPYYDPYSKPDIELNEMKKPSGASKRSTEKFETDFGLGTGSIANTYQPSAKS